MNLEIPNWFIKKRSNLRFANATMDGKENDEESFEDYSREDVSSSAADDEDERLPDGSILTQDDDQASTAYARRMSTDDRDQLDDHEGTSRSLSSRYGEPLSADEVSALVPAGDGGLVWHAQLVNDEWRTAKDVDEEGNIKPRRYDERLSFTRATHPPHARATRTSTCPAPSMALARGTCSSVPCTTLVRPTHETRISLTLLVSPRVYVRPP